MLILCIFAFLAGIATTLSPCILPVLPILLSAGVAKGRWRPFGIILGVILSFTFFTLALNALVKATGVSPNFLRYLAIIVIIFFGLVMIFPALSNWFARLTAPLQSVGTSLGERGKEGFYSGIIVGVSLGLVWTPCAGPILATIATLVATSSVTLNAIFLTLFYSLGAALPMFLIMYGGNRALLSSRTLSKYSESIRKFFGVLMVIGGLLLAFNWDVYFNQLAINYFPFVQVDTNPNVQNELSKLQNVGASPFFPMKESSLGLPNYGKAPDFVGIDHWINSPPLHLSDLKGKVVLVDFWTYSCINCIRTFPYLRKWYDTYHDKGFVIVGVHTPEFEFEKKFSNVEDAAKRFHLTYPIAQDNDYKTWQAFHNSYWPAHFLIDQRGRYSGNSLWGRGLYKDWKCHPCSSRGAAYEGKRN